MTMTGLEIVGVVGTVASVGGAVVAWWQAAKATTAAQAAKDAKAALLQRSAELSLSALHNEGCQARETTRALISGSRALRGFNTKELLARVHQYSDHIDECVHHAPPQEKAVLEKASLRIRSLLQELKSGQGTDRSEPPEAELHRVVASSVATIRRTIDQGTAK